MPEAILSGFEYAVASGTALVVLGLGGMLLRRSVLVLAMSGSLATLGTSLVFVALAVAREDPRGVAAGMLLLVLAAAWALATAAVALASYRRRGTENIDELTELRG